APRRLRRLSSHRRRRSLSRPVVFYAHRFPSLRTDARQLELDLQRSIRKISRVASSLSRIRRRLAALLALAHGRAPRDSALSSALAQDETKRIFSPAMLHLLRA